MCDVSSGHERCSDVWEQAALDGFNGTIFAYGQTGSGKTFSITGGTDCYADRGIIPRALSMLFNEFKRRSDFSYQAGRRPQPLLPPLHPTARAERSVRSAPELRVLRHPRNSRARLLFPDPGPGSRPPPSSRPPA